MKLFTLLIFILFMPAYGFCQSLTGFWTGSLDKGADPRRKEQSFELNLTEYKGKIYGYSYTTTLVNDTLFYIVKRVKGTINGDVCEIRDAELLSCNFMSQAEKDIKKTYTFHLDQTDSLWHLDGKWKTNKTKVFYSVSGDIKLSQEKDLSKSKLIPHLQELNIQDAIALVPAAKKETGPVKQPENKESFVVKTETKTVSPAVTKKQTDEQLPAPKDSVATVPKNEIAKTVPGKEKAKEPARVKTDTPVDPQKEITKSKPEPEKKKEDVARQKETTPAVTDPVALKPTVTNELPSKPVAAVNVEKRKSEFQQTVSFTSDSLSIALYDNGEIDGDTVSVLVNGEIIMANQGLKATAIKKTIYITPAMTDSFTLVLYAENLGKYPPNTGLMIVHDGDEVYQVRFSADLQKNVAVIFKRKKK